MLYKNDKVSIPVKPKSALSLIINLCTMSLICSAGKVGMLVSNLRVSTLKYSLESSKVASSHVVKVPFYARCCLVFWSCWWGKYLRLFS